MGSESIEEESKEAGPPQRESRSSAARAASRFAAGSQPDGDWHQR